MIGCKKQALSFHQQPGHDPRQRGPHTKPTPGPLFPRPPRRKAAKHRPHPARQPPGRRRTEGGPEATARPSAARPASSAARGSERSGDAAALPPRGAEVRGAAGGCRPLPSASPHRRPPRRGVSGRGRPSEPRGDAPFPLLASLFPLSSPSRPALRELGAGAGLFLAPRAAGGAGGSGRGAAAARCAACRAAPCAALRSEPRCALCCALCCVPRRSAASALPGVRGSAGSGFLFFFFFLDYFI